MTYKSTFKSKRALKNEHIFQDYSILSKKFQIQGSSESIPPRYLKQIILYCALLGHFLFYSISIVNAQSIPVKHSWPPEGKKIICKVTRDTWVSSVDGEKTGNNGGAGKLKLKGQQEITLLDIDHLMLKGKIVTGALLHLRSATPKKAPFVRLGISTMACEWVEGSSKYYRPQKGSACYVQPAYKERNWAYPGSTLMDVVFGRGHTIWKFADCSLPDQSGWQSCAVDPDVVAARIAGLSHGFCIYDEVGNIWSLKKGKFKYNYFPNRFSYSCENKRSAPWMEVWVKGRDSIAPEALKSINADIDGFPAGEALVRWKTPEDSGGSKTLGFNVTYKNGFQKKEIPRYLIPMAGKAGEEVRMHIKDLPFKPGQVISLDITPVDDAGNVGKSFTRKIQLSSNPRSINIPETKIKAFLPDADLPTVATLKVGVVDLLDKINPQTGAMIPRQKEGYKGGNHIFSAKKKLIRLQGARNEHVAFQINFEGKAQEVFIKYEFDQNPNLQPRIFEFGYVNVNKTNGNQSSILPDPLILLKGPFSIPSRAGMVSVQDQTNHSLVLELYVPHDELPGKKNGKVSIRTGNKLLELDVDLTVWNFTLPNKLSFIPEMNAYGKVNPYKGYEYYRLAHEHRTCINRLPYAWSGNPTFSPTWDGNEFDWTQWDQKVGPLLDGSAFEDLPRKSEPVDVLYLPFSENWPVSLFEHYKPSYWADEAFTPEYEKNLKKVFAIFAKHCNENEWYDTVFQFYLNNKVFYRGRYYKSSAPWLFDEPVNTQDFWALRWFGLLWRSAVDPVKGDAKMWYRGDISYGQFERDMFRGVMDIEYIGGNNAQKTRMKQDEQILWGKSYFSEYGTANPIEMANIQPTLWCLSAWSKGAMGVLPWQTIGKESSWEIADQTSLFYPHAEGPKPSVRLKAFTRGQQDVEYLMLFCNVFQNPHYAVAAWLNKRLNLKGSISRPSANDAGTVQFNDIKPSDLWQLRCSLGKILSHKAPQYKRSIVNRKRTSREKMKLPDIGYVNQSPAAPRHLPDCDTFSPR